MIVNGPQGPADFGSRFPRSARLVNAADFRRVFARPRRSSDTYFTVLAARAPGSPARLGLAIAKKQVRKAVARNRLKRLAREVFRHNRQRLAGRLVVVMARPAAATAAAGALQASLRRHFDRLAETPGLE